MWGIILKGQWNLIKSKESSDLQNHRNRLWSFFKRFEEKFDISFDIEIQSTQSNNYKSTSLHCAIKKKLIAKLSLSLRDSHGLLPI